MLIPLDPDSIENIESFQSTALDSDSLFNAKKTHGYEIIDEEGRLVNNDGLKSVKVPQCEIEKNAFGGATELIVNLSDHIDPSQKAMARLSFEISLPIIDISPELHSCSFSYFREVGYEREVNLLNTDLEIPACPILDEKSKLGGFDTHVYLPPKWEAKVEEEGEYAEGKLTSEGELGDLKDGVIWRARKVVEDLNQTLKLGNLMSFSLRMREPKREMDINALLGKVSKSWKLSLIAAGIGIASLILTIILFLIS